MAARWLAHQPPPYHFRTILLLNSFSSNQSLFRYFSKQGVEKMGVSQLLSFQSKRKATQYKAAIHQRKEAQNKDKYGHLNKDERIKQREEDRISANEEGEEERDTLNDEMLVNRHYDKRDRVKQYRQQHNKIKGKDQTLDNDLRMMMGLKEGETINQDLIDPLEKW
jgi:outer membrane protein assembly factor BamA